VLSAEAGEDLLDNVDTLRFPGGPEEPPDSEAAHRLGEWLSHSPRLQLLYDLLSAPEDRELLIRLVAYRVLGHRKVALPLTAERLRELVARACTARTAEKTLALGLGERFADDYDPAPLGYPIRLRAFVGVLVYTYQLEQYRCPGDPPVAVQPDDVVIDGGGYCGDSALYFSHLVGPRGRVVSFEFEAGNLEMMRHNLALESRSVVAYRGARSALWERPGERLSFRAQRPGTVVEPGAAGSAISDSIDALVERGVVNRVDFIKLDIEGSELSALHGAEATLRRFRPRLAIAAYHRRDDLLTIPEYIHGLNLGYRFRLRHPTMHGEETVLFAIADARPIRSRRWRDVLAMRR
jgi:FkbM family methyltransferase